MVGDGVVGGAAAELQARRLDQADERLRGVGVGRSRRGNPRQAGEQSLAEGLGGGRSPPGDGASKRAVVLHEGHEVHGPRRGEEGRDRPRVGEQGPLPTPARQHGQAPALHLAQAQGQAGLAGSRVPLGMEVEEGLKGGGGSGQADEGSVVLARGGGGDEDLAAQSLEAAVGLGGEPVQGLAQGGAPPGLGAAAAVGAPAAYAVRAAAGAQTPQFDLLGRGEQVEEAAVVHAARGGVAGQQLQGDGQGPFPVGLAQAEPVPVQGRVRELRGVVGGKGIHEAVGESFAGFQDALPRLFRGRPRGRPRVRRTFSCAVPDGR